MCENREMLTEPELLVCDLAALDITAAETAVFAIIGVAVTVVILVASARVAVSVIREISSYSRE